MENVRIAILNRSGQVQAFMDNMVPEALHYYNDTLHRYLTGNAYTFSFTVSAHHPDAAFLTTGGHLSFRRKEEDFFLNIITTDQTEDTVEVTCMGLVFELLFETLNPYNSTQAMGFMDYIKAFDFEFDTLRFGLNEVSDKRITHSWAGSDTVLARLYSLADVFDAEIQIQTHLNPDYTLNHLLLNVYRSRKAGGHGMGTDKTSTVLRKGKEITSMEKTSDISDICTAVRPLGNTSTTKVTTVTTLTKDQTGKVVKTVVKTTTTTPNTTEERTVTTQGAWVQTTISLTTKEGNTTKHSSSSHDNGQPKATIPAGATTSTEATKTETKENHTLDLSGFMATASDANGTYQTDGGQEILAPRARDRFPSTLPYPKRNYYICKVLQIATDSQEELWEKGLAHLKENCIPKLSYKVSGYEEAQLGDTFTLEDSDFEPKLYVQARIVEQKIHFYDPSQNESVFDNFTEVHSQISQSLESQMRALIAQQTGYSCTVSSDNGLFFKNNLGSTKLTAHVWKGEVDITDQFQIQWFKDGEKAGTDASVSIDAKDIKDKAVFRFQALDASGTIKGTYEVTVLNVIDGRTPVITSVRKYDTTLISADGKQIAEIKDGISQKLVSNVPEYYLSTSDKEPTGGEWSPAPNDFTADKYQWTRWMATYQDPDQVAYSDPTLDVTWKEAGEAVKTAGQASKDAQAAMTSATAASKAATDAQTQASDLVKSLDPLKQDIASAQKQAQDAADAVAAQKQDILSELDGKYVASTDLTKIQGELKEEIDANAKAIESKVSQTDYQKNNASVDAQLKSYTDTLTKAQTDLDSLKGSQADDAKNLANAQTALKDAQDRVTALENSKKATDEEVAAAKQAAADAQTQVTAAQKAVADTDAKITTAQKDLDTAKSDIASLSSRVTKAETSITENAKEVALKASSSDVSNALKSANSYTDSQLKVGLSEVQSQVKEVQDHVTDLRIGTRNLLKDSQSIPFYGSDTSTSVTLSGATCTVKASGHFDAYWHIDTRLTIPLAELYKKGETYTLSADYKASGLKGTGVEAYFDLRPGGNATAVQKDVSPTVPLQNQSDWTRISWQVTVDHTGGQTTGQSLFVLLYSGTDNLTGATIEFRNFKLERGNTPSDWTPAPEDTDQTIADVNTASQQARSDLEDEMSSNIAQMKDDILSEVSESTYTKDDTDQLIAKTETQFEQTNASFQMLFQQLQSTVDDNNTSANTQFQNISRYIRFTAEGIELGQSDKPLLLKIMDDRISFQQSGQEVAYLSDNRLVVTDANITDSLQLGTFLYAPRPDGSLDFR